MEPTRSILVCEEDAATRAFLTDNLTADGYHVLSARTKAGALAELEGRQPDLVLCDVNGDTLALVDAVRGARGLASHIDPDVREKYGSSWVVYPNSEYEPGEGHRLYGEYLDQLAFADEVGFAYHAIKFVYDKDHEIEMSVRVGK